MEYTRLRERVDEDYFTLAMVSSAFPNESLSTIRKQLFRFVNNGNLTRVKNGVYYFSSINLLGDALGSLVSYPDAYTSLESALQHYGAHPGEVDSNIITHVSNKRIYKVKHQSRSYVYCQIKPDLYFGYKRILIPNRRQTYLMANFEKAILDYAYFRGEEALYELDYGTKTRINDKRFERYMEKYPRYVQNYEFF